MPGIGSMCATSAGRHETRSAPERTVPLCARRDLSGLDSFDLPLDACRGWITSRRAAYDVYLLDVRG